MRTLNYLILMLLAMVMVSFVTSCRDKDKSDESDQPQVIRSNDELKPSSQDVLTAPQQLKSSLNDLTNEINDGFDEITSFEQSFDESDISQMPQSKRAKLRNNILLAKNDIQEKRRRLAELEDDLSDLNEQDKADMAQTITNLRQQLDLQKAKVDQLSAKLQASSPKPRVKSETPDSIEVSNLPPEEKQISPEDEVKMKEQREMLSNELNECYYVISDRNDLKNHKIIDSEFLRKTKVMQSGNLLISYFTKADKRTLNEILIKSKKVTLITNHDQHSYSIEETEDMTIIKILDPAAFWEYSNYLVVQVEDAQLF
ncbi:MAG: hypothetical protein IK100_01655 [Muribaculaceae bacterium]|nr:hypothetical protein [Muribaculaceae bacterium]